MNWCLSKGACKTTQTLKDFETTGAEYLQRNFIQHFILFPPCHLIVDEDTKVLVEYFDNLLKERYVRHKRVILTEPNIAYHFALVSNSGAKFQIKNSGERCLMVFVEELSMVLLVRVATSADDVKDQVSNSQTDVLNFIKSHGFNLKEENLTIASVVACPSVKKEEMRHLLPFQYSDVEDLLYDSLFICQDDLHSEVKFSEWWDASIRHIQERLDTGNTKTKSSILNTIIGQHMASMATVKEGLPTLSSKTMEQLDTLILNPKQMECINSFSKKKIIKGPFGSGKTLVGQEILKKLMTKLKNTPIPSTAFYITCDQYAIVDSHVKRFISPFAEDQVRFVCGSLHDLYLEYVSQDIVTVRHSCLCFLAFFLVYIILCI